MALYNSFPQLPLSKNRSLLSSSSPSSLLGYQQIIAIFHPIRCLSTAGAISSFPTRRTANYQPTIWDDSYIQLLPIDFKAEKYTYQRDKLKEKVKHLIDHQHGLIEQLELVDALCQLGIDYHFDLEIKNLLSSISSTTEDINDLIESGNLHSSALLFKLLRDHDINNASIVRADALISCFKKVRGSFNSNHQQYVKGMLSFYEASYLAVGGEEELDEAGKIAMEHLRYLDRSLLSSQLIEEINHALELPMHWRMPRLQARWYIDAYGKQENVNPTLLELAKLDFNIVQSIYKAELQELSRWWRNLDLVRDELNFARDRLAENYFFALGFSFQPEFWRIRKAIAKFNSIITLIDDIYDVYGTLDELKLFTNAIEEWNIDAGQQLPNYMKISLNALFNTMNDIATSFSKEKELDILPCLKRVFTDLCKAYLVEARWYHSGYTPTLNEYIENAWITIGGTIALITTCCLIDDLTIDALSSLEFYPPIIRQSCILLRLYNDLGTATVEIQRGDVSKSIQCYMKEKNVSNLVAQDYIKSLIRNYWKNLNQELTKVSKSLKSFRKALVDGPRTTQFFYQYGDGYGESYHKTKDQIISILIEPISL